MILIGRNSPSIYRDMAAYGGIEQHRTHRQPHCDVDSTLERHVDRPIGDLIGGAGQIDLDLVAANPHSRDNRQMPFLRVRAIDKPVDHCARAIIAVRQCCNCLPHQTLGVVHDCAARGGEALISIALDQSAEPLGADPCRGDLRLHIADDKVGDANVVPQ